MVTMRLWSYFGLFFSASVLASALNGVSPNPNERSISSEKAARHRSRRMTNGESLAMGLPSPEPKRLNHGDRVPSAPRSDVSASPLVSRTCNILVENPDDKSILGYISPVLQPDSDDYGVLQYAQAGALEVTFSYSESDSSPSKLDLLTTNGPQDSFPYFGGVADNLADTLSLGPERLDVFYLTATIQVQAGSTHHAGPSSYIDEVVGQRILTQSAIWAYDPHSQRIAPHWINSDTSVSTNYILYNGVSFIVTGYADLFNEMWQDFGLTGNEVNFYCATPAQDVK